MIAQLKNITHSFSQKKVIDNLSVSFADKKITALLGFSGSGKSTLLKMINGMIVPQEGKVEVFGKEFDYNHADLLRLKIGYSVQSVGLFPHLTIEENIGLLGNITKQNKTDISNRIDVLLDIVQLPKAFLKKYPNQLSGGEQQRVGLCRAFYLKPPLVLMDEPFASLDYKTRATIYKHLLLMQNTEGNSVIIVTHQLEEALHLCDDFVWIHDGGIYKQGDKALLKNSEHEFKEQYV